MCILQLRELEYEKNMKNQTEVEYFLNFGEWFGDLK